MAFSHDKLTFFILCFIIPQLIIVKAQYLQYLDTQESQSVEEKMSNSKELEKGTEESFNYFLIIKSHSKREVL